MLKYTSLLIILFSCLNFIACEKAEVSLVIDGSERFQQIDGFGVNANTRSWNGNTLEPALDMLLDSMNSTIWRVILETVVMWEDVNDNEDPFLFNWAYYHRLYETPKFQKAWDMIRYLNKRGIQDNLMLNFMGPVPSWMGTGEVDDLKLGGDIIDPGYEDEYVEMLTSFFLYARNVENLQFGLVSPFNETDHNGKEGPKIGPQQYVRILKKLMERMQAEGLGDIKYVAPDPADMDKGIHQYMPLFMEDSLIMSKMAHFGLHSYGGYYSDVGGAIRNSPYPGSTFWITEWNAWRNGLDDGEIGLYNYEFARECVYYLLDLLKNGARAALVWEGYDSYYEHHFPSTFSYWGIMGYHSDTKTYYPRKHLYAISQISKFVLPGSWQIGIHNQDTSVVALAFYDPISGRLTITGINDHDKTVHVKGTLGNLPEIRNPEFYYTDENKNLIRSKNIELKDRMIEVAIPANSIFTLTGDSGPLRPETAGWYSGDMHVHRNCGEITGITPDSDFPELMETNNLAVLSLLADMGNAEVKDSRIDLPKVVGKDAPQSEPGRIIHWDAEWHWDATYNNFDHQALGGHIVLLGLQEAHQIWDESPYKILQWGKEQGAIVGFCHMQYLNDSIQNNLDCCIPIDYPVEAALGTIDFLSEDVWLNDAAVHAYYKLLNCGIRLGWAAGTDYPCNNNRPLGSQLTYVQIEELPLTYRKWIEGIRNGRTVVSMNGHNEFLELKVNADSGPGDELNFENNGQVNVIVKWTAIEELTGRIEIVVNGKVAASNPGTAGPGKPVIFNFKKDFTESGWICARRMNEQGHQTHTAPVYITINNEPVRASAEDAEYFVAWIDNILLNIEPGGKWNSYFTHDLDIVQNRYEKARQVYTGIAEEAEQKFKGN